MRAARQTEAQLVSRATRLGDPEAGLAAIAELHRRLAVLETAHVDEAIEAGWSWQRIADALGVTRQSAHARHARRAKSAERGLVVAGRARQAVARAKQEAMRLGSPSVGTHHLLLALLQDAEGPVTETLAACNITPDAVLASMGVDGRPRTRTVAPDISPATREVLQQSMREAVGRGDPRLDVEHLLLAVLHESAGDGQQAILAQGKSIKALERRLARALRAAAQPSPAGASSS